MTSPFSPPAEEDPQPVRAVAVRIPHRSSAINFFISFPPESIFKELFTKITIIVVLIYKNIEINITKEVKLKIKNFLVKDIFNFLK